MCKSTGGTSAELESFLRTASVDELRAALRAYAEANKSRPTVYLAEVVDFKERDILELGSVPLESDNYDKYSVEIVVAPGSKNTVSANGNILANILTNAGVRVVRC